MLHGANYGTNPVRDPPLGILERGSCDRMRGCEQSFLFLFQLHPQCMISGNQRHLGFQVPMHRSVAEIRGSDEGEAWQFFLGQGEPESFCMERPVGPLVLKQSHPLRSITTFTQFLEELSHQQSVTCRDPTYWPLCFVEPICLQHKYPIVQSFFMLQKSMQYAYL